jgi:hypothetical protein
LLAARAARLTDRVVLPDPPFWEMKDRITISPSFCHEFMKSWRHPFISLGAHECMSNRVCPVPAPPTARAAGFCLATVY